MNTNATYCPNCKGKVQENDRFCTSCGTDLKKFESPTNSNKRVEEFAGKIIKCPNCGDPIEPFEIACDACGYVFQDVKRSDSIQQFEASLSALVSSNNSSDNPILFKEKLVALITGFSVPNNKQDIVEFFMLAQANIDPENLAWAKSSSSIKRDIAEAWLTKLNQAYSKAAISLANSKEQAYIESIYSNIKNEIDEATIANQREFIMSYIKNGIGFLVSILLLLFAYVNSTGQNDPALLIFGGCVVLWLLAYIEGKQIDKIGNIVIPVIACLIYIFIGSIKAFSTYSTFVQFGGIAGLVILLGSFITQKIKTHTSQ